MCFNSALDRQWAIALPPTALMNAPVFADVKAYIVGKEGRIWSVDTANGALNGSIAAGEPLTGTMVLQGDEIYVGGEEGVVLKLDTTVDAQTEEQP
jgi:hypothetical protein